MTPLRLTIEPIPARSRFASLANLLPRNEWNRVRRSAYRRAGLRCQACGAQGPLHCHEVWAYHELTRRQYLHGLQALCADCHGVKHLHFAHDPSERARLLRHFISVNRLDDAQAHACIAVARQRQHWLDQRAWTIDYGSYNLQIPSLPDARSRQTFVRGSRHGPRSLLLTNSDGANCEDYF